MGYEVFTRDSTQQKFRGSSSNKMLTNTISERYKEFSKSPIQLGKAERLNWSSAFNQLEVMRHLGAEIFLDDEYIVHCAIEHVADYHRGGMGISALNGAIISSLLDCVIAVSGVLQFPGEKAGTVELSIKIIKPLFGNSAYAEGFVTKKAKNITFSEGFLYDDNSKLCARASGIVSKA